MGIVHPSQTIAEFQITTITNGKFKENCYIIKHVLSGDCLLVDPGAESDFLQQHLESHGLEPQKILLTHGHFDHLGAVSVLMTRFEIACEVHAFEKRLVRQAATYAFRFGDARLCVPQGLTFFAEEESLDWNGRSVDVLSTPGHTAGSVALSIDRAFVFTGDTLFQERVGPTTYPESDAVAMSRSIAALLESLPPECVIFPGHGKPWSIGAARIWWKNLHGSPPSLVIF